MNTPTHAHLRLAAVQPMPGHKLALRFTDDVAMTVDLTAVMDRYPVLSALRDASLFQAARLDEGGHSVQWGDDDKLELAADNLRALGFEQQGHFSATFLWTWMARHHLTLDQAAEALGISRRMLAYYRSGERPVPRTVALACLGWESQHKAAA